MTIASAAHPANSSALAVSRVVKSFGGRVVLDVARLEVKRGEIHALLGQNGSGKSTLIKILSGFHAPDPVSGFCIGVNGAEHGSWSAETAQAAGIRFVHQDLGLVPAMTVVDNLHLGRRYPTRGWSIRSRVADQSARVALERVGLGSLDPQTPVETLRPAERTGVAIARAVADDGHHDLPTVLVLDEPTATLPAPEAERLLSLVSAIAASGVGVLYVTHHLDEVFAAAGRVSILRDGKTVASGQVASFTRSQVVHELIGQELEQVHRPADGRAGSRKEASPPRFEVREVCADFVDRVSFDVAEGEIVGLHGVSGSGRDTLLSALFGARPRHGGTVRLDGARVPMQRPDLAIRLGLGYVPADRKAAGCHLALTARENITLPDLRGLLRRGAIDVSAEEAEAAAWFSRLDVRPKEGVNAPMGSFSGGNQQKIVLAKWLRQHPKILLLDEPTQGVDVGAKAGIHRVILDAARDGVAVVIASSDEEELVALCSSVHVLRHGRIAATLRGDEISTRELGNQLNAARREPSPNSQQGVS